MATHTYTKEARRRFEQQRLKQLNVRLNDNTDADIITFLETVDNKRAYVLRLIREDIARRNGST